MTGPVTFRDAFPIYAVARLDRSLHFYQDLLGFTLKYRWPESGEIEFAALTLGTSRLGLGRRPESHVYTGNTYATGGVPPVDLCLYVDDLDRALSFLAENDVPILLNPVAQPWGERIAYVADPDGNQLLLIQPIDG